MFGAGMIDKAAAIAAGYGGRALIVTGAGSYKASGHWDDFTKELKARGAAWNHAAVAGEPSPEAVDAIVAENKGGNIGVVLAWGGGAVVDAGKAVSAMLPSGGPVMPYLEGVGSGAAHDGRKVPFIAVPTTAGTGSEATKNAVLSRTGPDGFKNSLRHDNFVPDAAIVDPALMLTCPPDVTAACGMDAFSQLLESYVSTAANPMTDALALSGLEALAQSLIPACGAGAGDIAVRGRMAHAALMSGITLAGAGLCVVHGLAGPMGGMFRIPHGAACGTLLGAAVRATIEKLIRESGAAHPALIKFARAGSIIAGIAGADANDTLAAARALADTIEKWTEQLKIPRLGAFGIKETDLDRIIAAGSNKFNPVKLSNEEMRQILKSRL